MQCDFTIRPRAQMVTRTFELALSGFIVVEFAVNNNVLAPILAGNGLVSGREVDNAESCMTQSYLPIRRNPLPLSVRAAVIKSPGSLLQHRRRNRATAREYCDDSEHGELLLSIS